MAKELLQLCVALGVFTFVVASAIAGFSVGRMLLRLRRSDISTHARLGEPAVFSTFDSQLTQQYLREKRYLQSDDALVRRWGTRYQRFLPIALAGCALAVIAMVIQSLVAI